MSFTNGYASVAYLFTVEATCKVRNVYSLISHVNLSNLSRTLRNNLLNWNTDFAVETHPIGREAELPGIPVRKELYPQWDKSYHYKHPRAILLPD